MNFIRVLRMAACLPFALVAMGFEALSTLILGAKVVSRTAIHKYSGRYTYFGFGMPRTLDFESAFAAARFDLAMAYDQEREKSERAETPIQRETA